MGSAPDEKRRRPGSPGGGLAFWIFRQAVIRILRLYFGYRVEGSIPEGGPWILAANHASFLDALVLGAVPGKPLRFLMTDLYAGNPLLQWFFDWNRVIYVREGGINRDMYRLALEALEEGESLGIFPEGGISRDGGLQTIRPGALSLAQRSGVAILPVAIRGTFEALPRGARFPRPRRRIRVRIGEPLEPWDLFPEGLSRQEGLEHGAELLEQALRRLLREGGAG